MDLGSLELQIFVSLTVVLGGAFVALVCDFLKGNNEQLREHNIELRVRKEEQERRLLLDPAGFLGQWLPGAKAASRPAAQAESARTVSAHEVMQSFAAPEALMEAETRTARFQARGGDDSYESANIPPLTQRRGVRNRTGRKGNRESYADWVRPEVIARVARKAQTADIYGSDIRDDIESTRDKVSSEPQHSTEHGEKTSVLPAPVFASGSVEPPVESHSEIESRMNSEDASLLQKEIERVSQLERQPLAAAPGTILRPLTVPSLKLEEEIQRVADRPPATMAIPFVWHSPLLEDVIAASATRANRVVEETPIEAVNETETPLAAEEVEILESAIGAEAIVEPGMVAEPVVDEVIAFQIEGLEVMEPAPFPFALIAAPVSVEEVVFQDEVHPPFTFVVDMEPVAVEEIVFQSEWVEAAEPPPFTFVMDADAESWVIAEPLVVEGIAFESEAVEAAEPPLFTFLMDGEPELSNVFAPVALEGIAFQNEALEALEPPPFTFVMDGQLELSVGVEPASEVVEAVEPPPFVMMMVSEPLWVESTAETNELETSPAEAAYYHHSFDPYPSRLAGMGISPALDCLPTVPPIEKPSAKLSLSQEPALLETLPDLLPLYSDMSWETAPTAVELALLTESDDSANSAPPPFWEIPAVASTDTSPIDISAPRHTESVFSHAPVIVTPDLLLPTGLHDLSTWTRLLSLPNPMTGILFVITLQPGEGAVVPERKGAPPQADNGPAIDKLMASFVREGDFGTRIAENEWIFIYNHDVAGFNQRRVGMISEKLWDFQLRHLGMANVNFKWGAVDVKSEPLGEAVQAARDRMDQTRRTRKPAGADQLVTRRVVNG